jgi:hypothetical protein
MYERRHQTASPVSLLAVTFVFVWACSSGGHNENNSVTAGGGAGSDVAVGSGPSSDGGALFEGGAPSDSGSAPSMDVGGSGADEPGTEDPVPTSGAAATLHAGAGNTNTGGTAPESRGGSESAGTVSVAGTVASAGTGAAGAPVVEFEPSCAPSGDTSTAGLVLPCAVSSAFYVCRNCHSNPPAKAGLRPYVTFQDIKPLAGVIYGVVKSGYMPWPPYTLSPYARDVMLKWLGKDGSCAVGVAHGCE